ncbi:Uncharacterized protein HZ326_17983 [Fusarium oxysporum f. sp. albedinis]|nr:Uncharacterized protein HZ326_17983 [Fusarium oxysporum f. sp. albedinis]
MNLASSPALLPLTLRDLSSSRPYCCENFISSKKCKNDREQKQIRLHRHMVRTSINYKSATEASTGEIQPRNRR